MTSPLCPYFGKCGGCTSQHLEYLLQLENKKKQVMQVLQHEVQVFHAEEYFYRNRMDFVFLPQGLGLREKNHWQHTISIERCVISHEKINLLLQEVSLAFRQVDVFDVHKHRGTFRYAVIRTTAAGDSSISFVLNEDSPRLQDAVEKIQQFAAKTSAHNVMVAYVPQNTDVSISENAFVVKGTACLHETFLQKTFQYPIQGFFQNNPTMAEKMHAYCRSIVQKYETAKAHLLDLYGGVGTFGIINADLFQDVTIVESYPAAIESAKENIVQNSVRNTTAVCLDAIQLKKLNFNLKNPLFELTDPPRTGMHPKTIQHLSELQPEVIIYVSCNVQQLARELPKLRAYQIKSAALFDLFPQTPHSEVVVELVKEH